MNAIKINLSPVIWGIFLTIVGFAAMSIWSWRAGLRSVRRWGGSNNFEVVQARRETLVPYWNPASSKGYQFFRVTLRDSAGVCHRARMRLEDYCTDPDVIEVIWDNQNPLSQ